ncbi:MAG: hypothetical protein A2174_00860 [Candidatus Portnoybacteria bacterium RBG_13_41_18]|uniref:Uncharacterized protein n=1 Tax=Candidatus Portnoybacteria bacterium RBG_13_41_18 TaxID=1801991 RepID=A0A1G2F801_9BACT|nr:MAG: hypothetical protein A2174_00860 [Candidatus Portnoybacteria bacterium RBG_13_41_18]
MKKIIPILIAIIIIGAVSFFGGMKYQQGKVPTGNFNASALESMTPEQRQAFIQQRQQNGDTNGQRVVTRGNGGNFNSGEIIAKDDKSITIKLTDGGSKIVFLSASTSINKTAQGVADDLTTGLSVTVSGTANDDGSLNAQSIQIRPNQPAAPPQN